MKDHIIFDVTDANTIADSDSVGAFVRSSDGTLIDHQTISSTQWLQVAAAMFDGDGNKITSTDNALDVNIASSDIVIDTDLDGIYNVSTNPVPDNVGIIAFDRAATPALTDQKFTPTGGTANADDVTAANVHALDVNSFLMGYDGSAWDRITATDGSLDVNITNSTVTVSDAALANTAFAALNKNCTSTAAVVVTSALTDRKYLDVYNNGNLKIYLGGASVTTATGFPVSPGSYLELRAGAAQNLYMIAASGTQDVRTLELS